MNGLGRKKDDKENKSLVFTRETLGVVLILFATLMLVCLITRDAIFSVVGQAVNSFLFGCFGFFAYAVVIFIVVMGVLNISGKSTGFTVRKKALITCAFTLVALISHIATINAEGYAYDEYLSASYLMGQGGVASTSAGGLFTALVAYVFCSLLTSVGSYVVLGIALAVVGYMIVKDYVNEPVKNNKAEGKKFRSSFVKEDGLDIGVDIAGTKEYPVEDVDFTATAGKQKLFVNNPNDFAVKNKRELHKEQAKPTSAIKLGFADGGLSVVSTGSEQNIKAPETDDFKKKLDYIKTPASIDMDRINADSKTGYYTPYNSNVTTNVSGYVTPREDKIKEEKEIPFIEHEKEQVVDDDSAASRAEMFNSIYAEVEETVENVQVEPVSSAEQTCTQEFNVFGPTESVVEEADKTEEKTFDIPFIDESEEVQEQVVSQEIEEDDYKEAFEAVAEESEKPEEKPIEESALPQSNVTGTRRMREIFFGAETEKEEKLSEPEQPVSFTSRVGADNNLSSRRGLGFTSEQPKEEVEPEKPKKPAPPINREYFRPPFDLLETYAQPINAAQENHQERMEIIQRTLEEFHINAVPQSYIQGPSVTRYEIMMPAGISVKNVLKYDDDLKMRLSVKDGVRIEAPIPGKNLVGIEVANSVKVTVGLKEVMEGLAGKKNKPTALMFAIGKDIVGNSISYDLAKGPHYLIAGATGSGKSVALHVMIVSLLMRYSPEELKLVLVDPKSVEFRKYDHIPHLLVDEIITEPKRALTLLQWAYDETNRRNEMFTACGGMVSNIDDYNTQIASDTIPKLPRIVFVIDELADLMEACKKDLEEKIRRIAAKSRSAGIHLVLATQRPSVDVITGTIKANLPSRIALKVMNFADSQTILGGAGAEKLLGNGDMLYKDSSMGDYERYQGAYISGREVTNIVNYIKEHNTAYFDDDVQDFLDKETNPKQEESSSDGVGSSGGDGEMSDIMLKSLWLAVNTQSISISLLQRRFQIGYARAGGLVDKMEQMGFVSGNEGSKARRVLLSKEEFISRFGPMDEADY